MYGFHINKEKRSTIFDALKEDISKYKIISTQIFVLNPRTSKRMNLGDLPSIKNFINKNKINLYVHSSYTTTSLWNDSLVKQQKGLKILITQMILCKKIGAKGLVIHLPKKSHIHVVDILKKYGTKINKTDINLLLEHPTFKSDDECSYEMPFQLNRLTEHINKIGLKKWGYTIDTAHLWSSITESNRKKGYTIETYKGANKWLKSLDKNTRNKIKLVHLNGSHNLCSSNKDKHAIPIYGISDSKLDNMWGHINIMKSGFRRFVKFAKAKKISTIIEMNVGTSTQLIKSMNMIKRFMQ